MPTWLVPHPDSAPPPVKIRVDVGRGGAGEQLLVSFRVVGDLGSLTWQGEGESGRQDELWRHGCFEAFIAGEPDHYIELNMAPTARWAAYRFDGYRRGMADAAAILHRQHWVFPALSVPRLELHARWELPSNYAACTWRLGLSAVIEARDGTKSYWALAHAPGPPDFHNPACFTAHLPPPARP